MQRGICLSPPFPRNESVCLLNNITNNNHNNNIIKKEFIQELFQFEGFDWTHYFPNDVINEVIRQRLDRISNCSHNWDINELQKIML